MCYCRRGSYRCFAVGQYLIRYWSRSEEVNWVVNWKRLRWKAYVKNGTYILRTGKLVYNIRLIYKQRAIASMKMYSTCNIIYSIILPPYMRLRSLVSCIEQKLAI